MAGWSAAEFLRLTAEEAKFVELKLGPGASLVRGFGQSIAGR